MQALTIKDNFLFGAVMSVEDNCRGFLEMVLESGEDYETLPYTFVIFICNFNPFDWKLYCYTFRNECREDKDVKLGNGSCTIFLSTRGENEEAVLLELVRFLKFVTADLEESERDFQDGLISQLHKTIREIKTDRELGDLRALLKLAAKADSLNVFEKEAEKYLLSSHSEKK